MHFKEEERSSLNELITIKGDESILIDARLLHQRLRISTKFTVWIQRRIEEYSFETNKDFFPKMGKTHGGRRSDEYHLTMDMAKELAMLERSEIGRKIRQYFIVAEKEARRAYETGRMMPKGVKPLDVNGRKVYPFLMFAIKIGMKSGGSMYYRRKTYPNHFIKFDGKYYISEEMANLMVMQHSVKVHRANVIAMQPLLPFDFGEPILQLKGGQA